MPIELKMPALSPTMEEGTLAKWLVKEGDSVAAGDLLAEIETDKATMEFEAVDEGTISKIMVAEGTDEVKVGTVIAIIAGEGEDAGAATPTSAPEPVAKGGGETGAGQPAISTPTPQPDVKGYGANPAEDQQIAQAQPQQQPAAQPRADSGDRVKASPLARRLAEQKGVDLATLSGSGPGGRIVKADIDAASGKAPAPAAAPQPAAPAPAPAAAPQAAPAARTSAGRKRLPPAWIRWTPTSPRKASSVATAARRATSTRSRSASRSGRPKSSATFILLRDGSRKPWANPNLCRGPRGRGKRLPPGRLLLVRLLRTEARLVRTLH